MTLFDSTYKCESLFSQLNFIKSKHRARLTNPFWQSRQRESATLCVSLIDDISLEVISFSVTQTWLFCTPSVDG